MEDNSNSGLNDNAITGGQEITGDDKATPIHEAESSGVEEHSDQSGEETESANVESKDDGDNDEVDQKTDGNWFSNSVFPFRIKGDKNSQCIPMEVESMPGMKR